MIFDLASNSNSTQEIATDVLVVGAGIAGLLVATRLAQTGHQVLVAESGGLTQDDDTHPLNEVVQLGDMYSGAERGRFRCLGGTSTRWGGAMLPFQSADLVEPHSAGWNVEWPIALNELTAYQPEIEKLFNLDNGPYDFPEIMPGPDGTASDFVSRLAKWPAFRLRNVATLLKSDIHSAKGPEIWLNATAIGFKFDAVGRLANVKLRSNSDRTLSVTARETIIAAGAIESTRLLLLADHQHDNRIFAPDGILGRYFFDHLSLPTARLSGVRLKAINRLAGFRFQGATMRNLRFEPSAELRARRNISAGFVHIACSTNKPTGFDALRDVYRKLQRHKLPSTQDAVALVTDAPWLLRAVWWRIVEKRLLFPDGAHLDVHTVVEQEPRAENRIDLSIEKCDRNGCPLARINWRVDDDDAANTLATSKAFVDAWNNGPLAKLARIEKNFPPDLKRSLALGGGVYHPGGSTRMGRDVSRGVVDSELRTFRVPNLSVLSTATFPTGGGANPTMMLMMAALRLADRILRTGL